MDIMFLCYLQLLIFSAAMLV